MSKKGVVDRLAAQSAVCRFQGNNLGTAFWTLGALLWFLPAIAQAQSAPAASSAASGEEIYPVLTWFIAAGRLPGLQAVSPKSKATLEFGGGLEWTLGHHTGMAYGVDGGILFPASHGPMLLFSANSYYQFPKVGSVIPRLHAGVVAVPHLVTTFWNGNYPCVTPGVSYGFGILKDDGQRVPMWIEFRGRRLQIDNNHLERQWQIRLSFGGFP